MTFVTVNTCNEDIKGVSFSRNYSPASVGNEKIKIWLYKLSVDKVNWPQ